MNDAKKAWKAPELKGLDEPAEGKDYTEAVEAQRMMGGMTTDTGPS